MKSILGVTSLIKLELKVLAIQVLFAVAYLVCLSNVTNSILDEMVFRYYEVAGSNMPSPQRWIVKVVQIGLATLASFAFGLAPFLVGKVWCKTNQFFMKMMEKPLLVKIMNMALATAYVLFVICKMFPWASVLGIAFTFFLPFALWMLYGSLLTRAMNSMHVQRMKGETFAEWKKRIGEGVAGDVLYAFMPFVSVVIAAAVSFSVFTF